MRALLLLGLLVFGTAQAQDWPTKPVRIIVPFPPGGSADLLPRAVTESLQKQWGQPVIVDNRPGAAGNIGAAAVYEAQPDGYTLLSAPPPPLVINRLLYPKLSYDSTRFVPMTVIAAIPNVLLVHPNVTASSVAELVAHAKSNPGKLNYASQGGGTTSHLTAELFKSMAGGGGGPLAIAHVPYKGTAPALADLLGGQVDLMFDNLGVSLPHVKAGKLRALAVASPRRFRSLPDVPALAETLPGFESVAWFGIVAPPKTPAAIAQKVALGVEVALRNPEVLKRLSELSADPLGLTPAETAAFMKQETERWGAVIKSAGVKLE
ncbi:MAG TPA: tripartite tricarboxylate transporter substrate binding protein [Burkholderiales bacterium]|nr:tripartite tricarboxylate transporter substrate binding protein [Burkholderiales bacterium]